MWAVQGIVMLVLSRQQNEEIVLGECVRIKVLEIRSKVVLLEITAPENLPIALFELPDNQSDSVFAGYVETAVKDWTFEICVHDSIYLAGDVRLVVVKIKEDADFKVVLGVEFPDEVSFSRSPGSRK